LAGHFQAISKHVPLRPIRAEEDYDSAVAALNNLLDAGAADEAHSLADLAATLGELIGDYDDAHYPAKDVAPSEMLRFLMDQHGLKQADLAEELGSQGVVSEVLNGKRELNLRQMRALASRFSVPVAAFVDGAHSVACAGAATLIRRSRWLDALSSSDRERCEKEMYWRDL
jgi:HTH-type transcriptional regulator/antitoxin HigA